MEAEVPRRVPVPPTPPFIETFRANIKETFFPDDPLKQFKREQGWPKRLLMALSYVFPIVEWAPTCTLSTIKSDLIAGITIASLAIPQGISYAKLANLPPIMGLYASFVPPLVYAVMGTSKHMAVGPVATASLVMSAMLEKEVQSAKDPILYMHLALTTTFFGGCLQAALGVFRLGFIVEFLSHAAIMGFMGGTATLVCLQQLKGMLGLIHFTTATDIISVMKSVFTQTSEWRWETAVMGICFLIFIFASRLLSKKRPRLFWISALAPLISVVMGILVVFLAHLDKHGVQIIGPLKRGINPPSANSLVFSGPYVALALKAGFVVGIIGLAEAIAVARIFALVENYNIEGNKEMIALGMMNIAGSLTSCFITAGPFSRSAVNHNAGCKTAASNIVMAVVVMFALLLLMPLFQYTPTVVLAAIIMAAMLGLINYRHMFGLWLVDKMDFCTCMGAYLGVVFDSIETGLIIGVSINIARVLLLSVRPRTSALGKIANSSLYLRIDQYSTAHRVPGFLILRVDAAILFANAGYLRERIYRWIDEEEEKVEYEGGTNLQYVVLDLSAVGSIDSSGTGMLEEVKKTIEKRRKSLQLVLACPGSEVMKKLGNSKTLKTIGEEWIFLTVDYAVSSCTVGNNDGKVNQDSNV